VNRSSSVSAIGSKVGFNINSPATGARVGSFRDAAEFGELIVLAVKGSAATEALRQAGISSLAGKPVIDTTNPTTEAPPQNGVLKFFTTLDQSLMERLQGEFRDAHFVKAFNSVGNAFMWIRNSRAVSLRCSFAAMTMVRKRRSQRSWISFGWETEDMGKVEAARAIEPLCILWCIPGFLRNDWMHAFKLLRKG